MSRDDSVAERALAILARVTGDDEVGSDLDLPLFRSGLLDSLGLVTLLLECEEAFGLAISPADLERESWATPRALVADLERRLAAGSG